MARHLNDTTTSVYMDRNTTTPVYMDRNTTPVYMDSNTTTPVYMDSNTTTSVYIDRNTTTSVCMDRNTTTPVYMDSNNTTPVYMDSNTTTPVYMDRNTTTPVYMDNNTTTSVYMDMRSRTYFSVFYHNSLARIISTSSYDCELYEFIVVGVVSLIIVIFGLIGNTLVKLTLWNERSKSPTSFLLIVLAFADNVVLIVGGFMMFGLKFCFYQAIKCPTIWKYYGYIYLLGLGVAKTANIFAAWMVVLVTVQRYIAVCKHQHKRYGSLQAVKIWVIVTAVISFLYSLPTFLYTSVSWDPILQSYTRKIVPWADNDAYWTGYELISYIFVLLLIPTVVLGYTTCHLVRILRESRKKRKRMTTKSREDITLSLVIVVITYIICHLPNPCRAFFYVTNQNLECGSVYNIYVPWSFNAAMLNSAINFIILVLCRKRFRLKFKATICFRRIRVSPESLETAVNKNSERTGNVLMMDTSVLHM